MIKKTQRKNLIRSIKKSGASFFAVAFIAATSIAIYCGLQFSADAELKSAHRYFRAQKLANYEIACANGITQNDIDELVSSGVVSRAEGGYSAIATVPYGNENIIVQVRSLYRQMNTPVVLEGRLPERRDEIAVEQMFAEKMGISTGDILTVLHDGMLFEDRFTVTAIINDPLYNCTRAKDARGRTTRGIGAASFYVSVAPDAFDADYYSGCFTLAYAWDDALDEIYYFSDEYTAQSDSLKEELKRFGEGRAQARYDEIRSQAEDEIADAEGEIANAEKELSEARDEIKQNEDKLSEGEESLAAAKSELEASRKTLEGALAAMGMDTDPEAVYEQIKGTGHPLVPSIEAYRKRMTEAEEAEKKLSSAREELESAKAILASHEAELEDKKGELEQARADVSEIGPKDWTILARNDMGDVRSIGTTVEGMRGLSYSMAIIFLLVAIVVCYSSIARMIDEQRVLVGTQKALGFQAKEILLHYLRYNFLCALLGILIGLVSAVVIVENLVLFSAYAGTFLFTGIRVTFTLKEALISSVLCLLIFLTAACMACSKLVKTEATELLRGEVPIKGKGYVFEKWKGYQRLSLYSRAVIKNLLNDKGRMAVTIMGVVGSIALLVICFSMKFAIEDAAPRQYADYFHYTGKLVFDSRKGSAEAFCALLEKENISYALVQEKVRVFRVNGGSYNTVRILSSTDEEAMLKMVLPEDIETKEALAIPKEGLLISRRCSELFGLKPGDKIEIADNEGSTETFPVAGVIEHYLPSHLFYVNADYYEKVMGEPIDQCVLLTNGIPEEAAQKAAELEGFLSWKDNEDDFRKADSLTLVILVCLVLSGVMALLVQLNQGVMNINRKARELAVMRINGFSLGQTKAYIYKDNIVLTAIGLLVGSAAGVLLSYIIVRFLEVDAIRYVRDANPRACLFACLVGSLFALIVNLIALRKIDRLNLTNAASN